MTTLNEVPVGQKLKVQILGFQGLVEVQERLQELGLRPGLELEVVSRAPFGGPLVVRYKTCLLALRSEEAQCTLIKTM